MTNQLSVVKVHGPEDEVNHRRCRRMRKYRGSSPRAACRDMHAPRRLSLIRFLICRPKRQGSPVAHLLVRSDSDRNPGVLISQALQMRSKVIVYAH